MPTENLVNYGVPIVPPQWIRSHTSLVYGVHRSWSGHRPGPEMSLRSLISTSPCDRGGLSHGWTKDETRGVYSGRGLYRLKMTPRRVSDSTVFDKYRYLAQ